MHAAARARRARAPAFIDPPAYARHRPETTQLYQLVERYWPEFRRLRARVGQPLPAYVEEEFDAYLKCGRLEEGFLRLRCEQCRAEELVAFSLRRSMSGATITTSPRSFGQSSSPLLEVMRVEAFSCRLMSTSANSSSSLKPSR